MKRSTSPLLLILASSSPRRIELLNQMGLKPKVIKPEVDETVRPGEAPRALVKRLARSKAKAVSELAPKSALIISADTIVVASNGREILNKPLDLKDARRMLGKLSGKTHTVLTGFCVLKKHQGKDELVALKVVRTEVKIRKLTSRQITDYLARGESLDKAGAYAAQCAGGTLLIEAIFGSYTNVVGLPTAELYSCIESYLR
jgi:septum formation protein